MANNVHFSNHKFNRFHMYIDYIFKLNVLLQFFFYLLRKNKYRINWIDNDDEGFWLPMKYHSTLKYFKNIKATATFFVTFV